MATGEVVDIQPQPGADEPFERFNWDTPILVSSHSPTRIYFASQRLWRSDNRGDEWTAISGDLTKNQERLELPIMGQTQSWDNAWDLSAMSTYNTITSLAESPQDPDLLYVGTDDGLIQVTQDGGEHWHRIDVGSLPGVPPTAFVNDLRADLFDADTVYVALDNHKFGDFTPYLLKSKNRGQTWQSLRSNLPDRTLVWRLVQDHEQPNLLFIATEFGLYFSVNGGQRWTQLTGNVPTISFRDVTIHRRDNDLVAASFGRGFFVLDDFSALREVNEQQLQQVATLFPTRDAWWYIPRPHLGFEGGKGDQGAAHFLAPNPPFGAVFTYYLKDDFATQRELRQKREQELRGGQHPVGFPGWEPVEAERQELAPKMWLVVTNSQGAVVRRIAGPAQQGFHRVAWDLRYPRADALALVEPPPPMWGGPPQGLWAAPGTYQVTLWSEHNGKLTQHSDAQTFQVVPRSEGSLDGADHATVVAFWREYEDAARLATAYSTTLANLLQRIERMEVVLSNSGIKPGDFEQGYHALRQELLAINNQWNGDASRREVGEKAAPTIHERLSAVSRGIDRSTYGPTATHRQNLAIVQTEIVAAHARIVAAQEQMAALEQLLLGAGAPWLEGAPLPPPTQE